MAPSQAGSENIGRVATIVIGTRGLRDLFSYAPTLKRLVTNFA